VPAEELPRLGERFWRSGRTARESGTGLGVSIAKSLMERHGGRLAMSSTADRGLQVRLLIPLETVTDELEAQGSVRR
jgi:signal transduction histidine kinase